MSKQGEHGITWTDETWNPIRGCTRVSEGCRNCYAESVAARFSGPGQPYEGLARMTPSGPRWTGKIGYADHHLLDPLRWTRPRRIFVNSMSDLFHDGVSQWTLDRIFAVMALAPRHQFQVLTKRPSRMLDYLGATNARSQVLGTAWEMLGHPPLHKYAHQCILTRPWPLPNVWLGVSVEDQATADQRIPLLLQTPAAVRWVSAEPLLGPLDLERSLTWVLRAPRDLSAAALEAGAIMERLRGVDWVVVGGESGPGARPMHPEWAQSLRDQCQAAGVPYFFKQWGEWVGPGHPWYGRLPERELCWMRSDGSLWERPPEDENADCVTMKRVGKRAAGDLLDMRQWREFPEVRP